MIGHATGQKLIAMENFIKLQGEHQQNLESAQAYVDLAKRVVAVIDPLVEGLKTP